MAIQRLDPICMTAYPSKIFKTAGNLTLLCGLLLTSLLGQAQEQGQEQQAWQTCIQKLQESALQDGVRPATVTGVFADIVQIPRVIQQDRNQAEFSKTFTQYYQAHVTQRRVDQGRALLLKQASLLTKIQASTGIPSHYLLALWGLETNFGSYFGKLSIPSALTTLACDSRRSAFFARELLATLHIIDAGDIAAEDLIGSWAGAIGHMQFMPTTYVAHAVDADNDGRRDLLGSVADALTSGGSYLADLGWQTGYRWGREVRLPADFDYSVTGSHNWQPLRRWAQLGITDVFGNPIGSIDLESALLLPSGHTGPAFLVYPNFRIIMKWNRSEHYAISVGRLADRIAGAGKLIRTLPKVENSRLATTDVYKLQTALNQLGYDTGKPDGILGPATRKAVQSYQKRTPEIADGYPTPVLVDAITRAAMSLLDLAVPAKI